MLSEELLALVRTIQSQRAESQTVEVKAGHDGCPKRLYDTLSSFSNQDDGGVIVFGLDERSGFATVGVSSAQEIQKGVAEQCDQMEPRVRAVFTTASVGDAVIVSAEIPGMDLSERPCFYAGKGRLKGSYVRVGEADEPMTEYEVYSFEAYRNKYKDELQPVERADMSSLDESRIASLTLALKANRPNLARLSDEQALQLMSYVVDGRPTLAFMLLAGLYPQAFYPQLSIIATRVPGTEVGSTGTTGERFLDNKRIEGTLSEQLSGALSFVRANMRTATAVDPISGRRIDVPEYPIEAVRELVLNALIHRDYSPHTLGMPIQLQLFDDRLVIANPGGLYGRIRIDELGKTQPDTRNPVIATSMETLHETENRYSGIPTVRRLMAERGMEPPLFESTRGEFRATLHNHKTAAPATSERARQNARNKSEAIVLEYCKKTPRSRDEIAEHLDIRKDYAARRYINPLVKEGMLRLTKPETPGSPQQRYFTVG